jgi:hypothetical protein
MKFKMQEAFGPIFPCCVNKYDPGEQESDSGSIEVENAFSLNESVMNLKSGKVANEEEVKRLTDMTPKRSFINIEGFDNIRASKTL